MKDMKKTIIIFGAVVIALLMMSTVTAVPAVQSKPVMNQIQQKEILKNRLISSYNKLNANGELVLGSQQNFNLDPTKDLEKLFDEEGFLNYIVSDGVIQFLNDNYNSIVSDSLFQDFYNSEYVQEFIQSDEFVAFMNSDEVQYMLDHFNPGSGSQNLVSSQEVTVNGQVVSVDSEQQSSVNGMGVTGVGTTQTTGGLEGTATATGSSGATIGSSSSTISIVGAQPNEWFPGMIIMAVFLYLLIGLIGWIPAAIIGLLLFPEVWAALFIECTVGCMFPLPIISLIGTFLLTLALYVLVVGLWPLIWLIVILVVLNPWAGFPFPLPP